MLTATNHSYIGASRDFVTFPTPPWRLRPQPIFIQWLKRHGFMQGRATCSNNRYFSYALISRPPKRSKFGEKIIARFRL